VSGRRILSPRATPAAEDGVVIVMVMMLLMIGLLVGVAALSETLVARSHADRSQRSARALQAADAGIATELYRANQLNLGSLKLSSGLNLSAILSQLLTCPVPQINASGQVIGLQFTAIASIGSPCPANSSSGISNPLNSEEPAGHHSYFQTAFIPGLTSIGDFVKLNPKIVASGVEDNGHTAADSNRTIPRRVEAVLAPVMPWRTLEAGHDLTIDVPPALGALGIKLAGTAAFNGTAAAGNDLTIGGQSALANVFTASGVSLSGGLTEPAALDYCGNYSHPNLTVNLTLGSITQPSSNCNQLVNRSPIQISPSKQNCVPVTGAEVCSSDTGFGSAYVGGRNADGTVNNALSNQNEIYNTNSGTALSFGPGDYVFCSFQTNGPVNLNPTSVQAVRIFIDTPSSARCKNFVNHTGTLPTSFVAGPGSFIATQGAGGNPLAGTLAATHPSQDQIYVAGNGTNNGTTAYVTGSSLLSGQALFLYAPTSNVTVSAGLTCVLTVCVNAGTIAGAIVGYDVTVSGTAVTEDLGLLNYPLSSTLGPFRVQQYIECSPQYPLSTTDPANGC
jgi:hypothetical protein